MKTLQQLFYLSSILFFLACSKLEELPGSNIKVEIDVTNTRNIYYSQLFDTVQIIPLQTQDDALIGQIKNIYLKNGKIFILDSKKSKSVFIYKTDGTLIRSFKHLGDGPTQYLNPTQMHLSEDGTIIYIMDSLGYKQLAYSLEGEFLYSIKLNMDNAYVDFLDQNGSFYFVNLNHDSEERYINKSNQELNPLEKIKVSTTSDIQIYNGIKHHYLFEKMDSDGFYYNGFLTNKIISIEDDKVKETLHFSFSQQAFEYPSNKTLSLFEIRQRIRKSDSYILGEMVNDSNSYLFFDIMKGNNVHLGIYEKQKQTAFLIGSIMNDMDGLFPETTTLMANWDQNGRMITSYDPQTISYLMQRNKPNNPYLDFLKSIQIDDTDNPILFIYQLKKEIDFSK